MHQDGVSCVNLYCVVMTYVRLRSGHMTYEKGLLQAAREFRTRKSGADPGGEGGGGGETREFLPPAGPP